MSTFDGYLRINEKKPNHKPSITEAVQNLWDKRFCDENNFRNILAKYVLYADLIFLCTNMYVDNQRALNPSILNLIENKMIFMEQIAHISQKSIIF